MELCRILIYITSLDNIRCCSLLACRDGLLEGIEVVRNKEMKKLNIPKGVSMDLHVDFYSGIDHRIMEIPPNCYFGEFQ
jgi:hypothetical protein